jgi:hypothetical protein
MKTPHTKATEIASLHDNAINCLKSMLRHGIATLSEGGTEQETFDALPAFGKVPAKVLEPAGAAVIPQTGKLSFYLSYIAVA